MQSIKNIAKRFLSLSLALMLIMVMLPSMTFTVLADEVTGLSDSGILLEKDNDNIVVTASGNTVTASVAGDGTCNRSKTGTLTIKNGKTAEAVLKFDYAITLNGGMVSVDGTAISSDMTGSYEKTLQSDESLTISIQSPASGDSSTVSITNISMLADVDANVTFLPAENGSYTVDGAEVTDETTLIKNSSETFALAATPASGFKFLGWKDVNAGIYLSFSTEYEAGFDRNLTVQPVFTETDTPVFSVGSSAFTDLNEATSYATANNESKIVLISDGTLAAGDYTVPSGIVLLIPFDNAYTLYTTEPTVVYEAHVTPTPFKTLTLSDGANIIVEESAAVSVGSRICAHGTNTTSWNGTPTSKYGQIILNDGSSIKVQNGGYLFAYGYISGSGSVDILDGGHVYELFQIRCWRGGSASTNATFGSNGVFPMNQYYVQNIEAPMTIESGATENVVAGANVGGSAMSASATFIGEGGMFVVNQGSITKRYDGANDRLVIDVDGDISISPLSLSISGSDMNTESFVLPINNNISININSGSTSLAQDVGFLPGSEITISNGSELKIESGSKAYVYDVDEWGDYAVAGAKIVPVGYSTVNGATVIRKAADLTDARFNVNGTLTVNGEFYTTQSGAEIVSTEGTGKIVYNNAAGTQTETYQCTQSNTAVTAVAIPITSAQLKNGNTEVPFTETADAVADDYYTYSTRKDMWIKGDDFYYTINFKNTDGTVISTVLVDPEEVPVYDGEEPTREEDEHFTYEFAGWDSDVVAATEDKDYTAVFNRIHKDGWYNDGTFIRYYIDNAAVTGIARVPYPEDDFGLGYAEDAEGINDAGFPNDGKGTFIFDANGILHWDVNGLYEIDGSIPINADYPTDYIAEGETVYVKNGEIIWHPGEVAIDGDIYYFAAGNDMVKGKDYSVYRVDTLVRGKKYTFDAEGKLCKYDGLVDIGEDTYYYKDYAKTYAGLIEIDGDYYYINSACKAVKNREYYVVKTNNLMPSAKYQFGADGKMVLPKNGIVKEADGWFYYKDDVRYYAGLFKIGNDYYYAKTNCEVIHGQEYYISKTNGLLPQGRYTFDEEGRLVMLDGIVKDDDVWTYYVNGAKVYAGLFKIGNDIYYAKSDCTVVHGTDYYVSKTNGLLPQGRYTFDSDGKLQLLNGIVKNGDDWTYYENGAKVYAGIINIDGYFYYVNSSFKVIHGRTYFVCKTNGHAAQGSYEFDSEGHMTALGYTVGEGDDAGID